MITPPSWAVSSAFEFAFVGDVVDLHLEICLAETLPRTSGKKAARGVRCSGVSSDLPLLVKWNEC